MKYLCMVLVDEKSYSRPFINTFGRLVTVRFLEKSKAVIVGGSAICININV
jgi:hypothetical protein